MTDDDIRRHLAAERPRWTAHAEEQSDEDALLRDEVWEALGRTLRVVEDYPNDPRGASALVLTRLRDGSPVHAQIGVSRIPWVVVTVYRPDRDPKGRWNEDYTTRR